VTRDYNDLSGSIIAAAIEVHKALGPGLLESAYAACLCRELKIQNIFFQTEVPLPVKYKGVELNCGYIQDIVVDDRITLELKAVEQVTSLHKAQLLTYLRLSDRWLGLLINFNVPVLVHGIERIVNGDPR
jgi:GxxExxY protein